jgi:hypothetical protein
MTLAEGVGAEADPRTGGKVAKGLSKADETVVQGAWIAKINLDDRGT